jgi:hypothetical protein
MPQRRAVDRDGRDGVGQRDGRPREMGETQLRSIDREGDRGGLVLTCSVPHRMDLPTRGSEAHRQRDRQGDEQHGRGDGAGCTLWHRHRWRGLRFQPSRREGRSSSTLP